MTLEQIQELRKLEQAARAAGEISGRAINQMFNAAPSLLDLAEEALKAREFAAWSSQLDFPKDLSVTDAWHEYRALVAAHDAAQEGK